MLFDTKLHEYFHEYYSLSSKYYQSVFVVDVWKNRRNTLTTFIPV